MMVGERLSSVEVRREKTLGVGDQIWRRRRRSGGRDGRKRWEETIIK